MLLHTLNLPFTAASEKDKSMRMPSEMQQILRVSFWRELNTNGSSPAWLPHAILGLSMSLFYAARWFANQQPPSAKGLLFPPPAFYGISAILAIIVWPSMVALSASCLCALSSAASGIDRRAATKLYAYPLFFWLGCVEFAVWSVIPANAFRLVAPIILILAMSTVLRHFYRELRKQNFGRLSSLGRSVLSLMPQLLVAGLFIR